MIAAAQPLPYDPDIAPAAALIADPTRAAILRSWIERGSAGQSRRSVRITPAGAEGLASTFGLDVA